MHFGFQENTTTTHSKSLTNSNEVLADIAQVGPGDRVLDAGCGLGGSSLWLAVERRASVTGIALGADQISWARREAQRRALSKKVQFLVADFTALPFPARSFNVVWAQESLCHATDKSAFFEESSRILEPGGRVVIADFMLRRPPISDDNRALLEEWFDGWALPGLWTAAQHANAARAAGLCDISIQDVTRRTFFSHLRLYRTARRLLPFATLLHLVGLRNSVQNGNVVAAIRQYQTLKNDCWFYSVFSARKPCR